MIAKKWVSGWALTTVFGLGFPLGCSSPSQPETEPSGAVSAAPKVSETKRTPNPVAPAASDGLHRAMHGGGFTAMVHAVLEGISLKEEQKAAVEAMHSEEATAPFDAYRDAYVDYYKQLAAAVRKGPLDSNTAATALDSLQQKAVDKHEAQAKMVAKLHGILDADQRRGVVAAATDWLENHPKRGGCPFAGEGGAPCDGDCPYKGSGDCPFAKEGSGPHSGGCPHADVAGGCPHADVAGGSPYAAHADGAGGCPHVGGDGYCDPTESCPHAKTGGARGKKGGWGVEKWLDGITLDDAQHKAVAALTKQKDTAPGALRGIAAHKERHRAYFNALFEGFEKDTFVPPNLETASPHQSKLNRLSHQRDQLVALSGILNEAQRALLASNLERKATRMQKK